MSTTKNKKWQESIFKIFPAFSFALLCYALGNVFFLLLPTRFSRIQFENIYNSSGSNLDFTYNLLTSTFSIWILILLFMISFIFLHFKESRQILPQDFLDTTNFIKKQFNQISIAIVISFLLCGFIALVFVLSPNYDIKYNIESTTDAATESMVDNKSVDSALYVESKLALATEYLKKEFNIKLFTILLFLIYFAQFSGTWNDYFPTSPPSKESGIHAKLNYQVIADQLSRKLSVLLMFIFFFAIVFVFSIFRFATDLDTIIHDKDIAAYNDWISAIEGHLGKGEKELTDEQKKDINQFIEENTKTFWYVFFTRFILVRTIIAFTVGIILSFLIRLYGQTRNEKESIIGKEEALSALHYLARGEWRFKYDLDGNLLYSNDHEVIIEKEYNKLKPSDKKGYQPMLLEHLVNNSYKDAHLKTKDLLNIIPVHELFKSSYDTRGKNKNKNHESEERTHDTNVAIKSELSDVTEELRKITQLLAHTKIITKP